MCHNYYLKLILIFVITLLIAFLIHICLFKKEKNIFVRIIKVILIVVVSYGIYQFIITKDHAAEMQKLKEQLKENEKTILVKQEEYEQELKKQEEDWTKLLSEAEITDEKLTEIVSNLPVVFIGDSVMLGAKINIQKQFPKSYFDAKVSRSTWKGIEVIQELIKEGLWPAPGGAWCSAGVPIYDKMSECGDYPVFKHYDYKGEDVTHFANLDCQTPYYFVYLENGTFNKPVIEYFINYMQELQKDYNFDGFRVDHIDHIVDKVSEKDGIPISYRAPRVVLGKLNSTMKSKIPYFGTLAEYMLWDNFLKEYHEDMNFDLLWGNDIVSQQNKTPEVITEDNQNLTNYNINFKEGDRLSILKTYNNQDGEFQAIDQYPGQLTAEGALFKWAKYKLLSGGKYAQRPVLYLDGDESFTKRGTESVIGEEMSLAREKNYEFFEKFDAIDRFVKSQPIITDGEAQIMTQDEDGFAVWMISKEPLKKAFLVVSNYHYPTEFVTINENGESRQEWRKGQPIFNKEIKLPTDFTVLSEYVIKDKRYSPQYFENPKTELSFEELKPSEFRIFAMQKM